MKTQLHVSGLAMLARCGEAFRRRYLEGHKIPPSVSIIIGVATDRSVTADLANKIAAGELLPAEQIKDTARDALVETWERGYTLREEDEENQSEEKVKANAIDSAVSLASLHHEKLAPALKPSHVQRNWVLDISDLDIQLAGTIDIQEGRASIRDTKTSKKAPPADAAAESLQLSAYALAVKMHDGAIPERVALDYLIRTKQPKFVILESKRTNEEFMPLLERVYQASRVLESGLFMPAPVDSWYCSARWCGYFATCKYAVRPVSVAMNGVIQIDAYKNGRTEDATRTAEFNAG
jgi:CRISPR/Cas system-associated exonuclease Cas4 (RecB family)